MEQFISAFFYTLSVIVLAGVVMSYCIALSLKKSVSVLALLIYFIANLIVFAYLIHPIVPVVYQNLRKILFQQVPVFFADKQSVKKIKLLKQ